MCEKCEEIVSGGPASVMAWAQPILKVAALDAHMSEDIVAVSLNVGRAVECALHWQATGMTNNDMAEEANVHLSVAFETAVKINNAQSMAMASMFTPGEWGRA